MFDWRLPSLRRDALTVLRRNLRVWRKLLGPAVAMNFGEPLLYLLGFGYGLGIFIGQMADMPYLTFLASGIIASSAMTTASFEGMYSVFTRMVPQRTYEALLATPLEIDDILAGEMLWCGTKALFSGIAILAVASLLGVVNGWQALLALPVVFLTGLCFAGPAIIMSALASNYDFFNYYFVLVVTPMMLLCGVFYPIDSLPALMQGIVQVLPLTHAVALTRPLVAGQAVTDVGLHLSVLAAYTLVSYYLAVVLVRRRLLV
ncbi:transport permease protein [Thiohalobacter sp. COW1]|uniref:Transport permease protein n=1 Tax=Thiohalobacter thiocyanaticus TaxID=585455 RepID=A0A1Z4VRH2_9GAMM|nr:MULTISPECIES: ABC transporter permease [Thiohalobacter]BAZ93804.1 ABC-type multidrug transporter, permease component [Thiohalobacter thiocyanaticus]BCO31136.1 transport permease protein [Thiohalobacter sp. COW1]